MIPPLTLDDISDMEEERRNAKLGHFPNEQAYDDRVKEMVKELAHCNSYHRMRNFEAGRIFLVLVYQAMYGLHAEEIEEQWPRD